ncbi:MAG: hypothetical protein LBJ25_04060, partial [Candidatus Margulisbacteria bacterium]|nr:hypothetical protein [Candidatus Margulisiibacteriota bacterium]
TGTIENGGVHSHTLSGSATDNGSHTHTITGGAISGTVSSSGSGTAFDNRPSYYTLIYIVKVTAAGG